MVHINKIDQCDFCIDENYTYDKHSGQVKKSDYQYRLHHKTFNMCEEHAREVYKQLKKIFGSEEK